MHAHVKNRWYVRCFYPIIIVPNKFKNTCFLSAKLITRGASQKVHLVNYLDMNCIENQHASHIDCLKKGQNRNVHSNVTKLSSVGRAGTLVSFPFLLIRLTDLFGTESFLGTEDSVKVSTQPSPLNPFLIQEL